MAILEQRRQPVNAPAAWTMFESPEAETPSFRDTVGAAFRLENIVTQSLMDPLGGGEYLSDVQYENVFGVKPATDFNPWEHLEGTVYEEYFDSFAGTRSLVEFQQVQQKIDRELRDRETIANAGGAGFAAAMAAGFLDAPTAVPGFGALRGGSVLRNAARTSAYAASEAVVVESILHNRQETRTLEESAFAVGGSIVLGGLLGGLASGVKRESEIVRAYNAASKSYDGRATAFGEDLDQGLAEAEGRSLSAAASSRDMPEDFQLPTTAARMVLNSTPSGVSFNETGAHATALSAKRTYSELLNNPYAYAGVDRQGSEVAVSTAIDVAYDKAQLGIAKALNGAYRAYAQSLGSTMVAGRVLRRGEGVMSTREFAEQVAFAMRRGDAHEIEQVAQAAQELRRSVVDPLKERAIRNGLLPEDVQVETADSYFTRMWDSQQIERRGNEFKERLASHLVRDLSARLEGFQDRVARVEAENAAARAAADTNSLRLQEELAAARSQEGVELSQSAIDQIVSELRNRPKRPVSLLKFLSDRGLANDAGGEVSNRDLDRWHVGKPGTRKLVRDDGLDLDTAAEFAEQYGYIETRDINLLLEKIDDELRGAPVYSRSDLDDAQRLEAYQDLENFAGRLGISATGRNVSADRVTQLGEVSDLMDKAVTALSRLNYREKPLPTDMDGLQTIEDIRAYSVDAAESVFRALTGRDATGIGDVKITVNTRGPMKERTLNVRDEDFEDFLVNDAEYVLSRYSRIMSADVALKERFGDQTLKPQIEEIEAEYDQLISDNPARADNLAAERRRVVERLEAARDLLRGTYRMGDRSGIPYRTIQAAMSYNFIRILGGLVLSALPDMMRASMAHGARNMWSAALKPMIANTKQYKLSAKKGRELAGIAEVELGTRMASIADITDPIGNRTPTEAAINNMSSWASLLSGGLHWNNFMKGIATQVTTRRIRDLSGSKADERFRARIKLNKADANRIQSAMQEYGEEVGGVFDPHTELWPEDVRDTFANVLRADADTVIVTPGVGDRIPGAEHHYWLKPALQFKSFAFAAHRKVLLAGLQEDQTRFLMNATTMSAMGMFVYWAKSMQSGRDPFENDIGVWIAEGIDRGGLIPLYMEANNMLESLGVPGVYSIMGDTTASRYQSRNFAAKILGPTAGLIDDTLKVIQAAVGFPQGEEFTEGDVGALRRLVPFGRHPGIKEYLDLWLVPELKSRL